ncbi:MAG TPA: D-cysteine desulfhydrase family protein [Porticoccaceae bacterium]|nr:D-cysteine desulfhydrase family protein [Porticoccaceae bacterium]
MAIVYPPRLPLARLPTPLEPLDRLSALLGGPRIWVKRDDLTGCATTGNKVRKLEFTLARARAAGADTLITAGGLQSNHCRATALLGARLGMRVHLLLREEGDLTPPPRGNLLLDLLAGAVVSRYDKAHYRAHLPELYDTWCAHYRERGAHPWPIAVGASDGTGVWGYVGCAAELAEDFRDAGIRPGAIVHATGSGGTQAGLTAGAELYGLGCPVIGMAVCDDAAYFQAKVRADLRDWAERYRPPLDVERLVIRVNDRYIGPGYGSAGPEVFATIRQLAREEGLILDPVYTGKAFHGLLEEIRAGAFAGTSDLVFIHTGGLFGLFAQSGQLGL